MSDSVIFTVELQTHSLVKHTSVGLRIQADPGRAPPPPVAVR